MRELSRQFNEKFNIQKNFTFAFMDSFSQAGPAQNDEIQQIHWIEETNKLWEEANRRNSTFDFKTIDDVLEENAICRKENIELHRIIDEEIAKLKEDVAENSDLITNVSKKRG